MNNDFTSIKVFEAFKLPTDLYYYLTAYFSNSNAVYRKWIVLSPDEVKNEKHKLINQWLLDHGASIEEKVLLEFGVFFETI